MVLYYLEYQKPKHMLRPPIRASVSVIATISLLLLEAVHTPTLVHADENTVPLVSSLGCVVTAYYQPVPGQANYIRGDFAADVALNGDDITANGKKVSVGTVAAPPQYPFGTIVDIGGFGVGQVSDRGGAIKGNRFDIWVGKGEEGLARATNWGKRTTQCTVYLPGSEVPAEVTARIGTYNLPSATLPANYWEKKQSAGRKNLSLGDTDDDVGLLIESLQNAGYTLKASKNFDQSVNDAVIDFQIKKNIIKTKSDSAAGVVGPKTWQALLAKQSQPLDQPQTDISVPFSNSSATPTTKPTTSTPSGNMISLALAYGAEGEEVSRLQQNLRLLGYFDNPTITGYFGDATKAAIIRFQIAEGLIVDQKDAHAGEFDDTTRKQMMSVLFGQTTTMPAPVTILKRGSKGVSVTTLQENLEKLGLYSGPHTDFFGEQTEAAVKQFQEKYNVTVTSPELSGVVDRRTADRLDQAMGLDISLSPAFTRYLESFSLVSGRLVSDN